MAIIKKQECPECRGTRKVEKDHGWLVWDEPCKRCNALGYLEEEVIISKREYDELLEIKRLHLR